jgi:hypothetical protein
MIRIFGTALAVVSAALPGAVLFDASAANATVILFSNFDNVIMPAPPGPSFSIVSAADGWTGGPLGIEIQSNNVAGLSFSGTSHVELDTTGNSFMFVDLAPGRYRLDYWYSPRPNQPAGTKGIEVLFDNVQIDSIALAGGSQTSWSQRFVDFRAPDGGRLTFAATGTADSLGGYLDDIRISSVVPEPASWAMLLAGFGLIGAAARRRRPTPVIAPVIA